MSPFGHRTIMQLLVQKKDLPTEEENFFKPNDPR